MNELLIVNNDTQTVSARELHEKLNIKTAFKDWFPRMCEYGFTEGEDFNSLKNEQVRIEGNREVKREIVDYNISLDMAKQICMIQRTPEGKEVRQYLIDLEKAWNTPEQVMARALRIADKTIESLKVECKALQNEVIDMSHQIMVMTPKVNYVDKILQSKATVTVTQIAQDYGMSAKALNKLLAKLGIQRKVNEQWILYSAYLNQGYVHSKTVEITRSDGRPDCKSLTEWTQKGRLFLYETLKQNGYIPLIEQ